MSALTQPVETLVIIPARGGSVGVPRKNVRPLGGTPLIAWSIRQARATEGVTRVVVSTDDAEIAAVSRAHGAEVIDRPAELAGPTASSESALHHALATLAAGGYRPDRVVFLQCTSPLRRPDDIQRALDTFDREEADSLFSCCVAHGFMWRLADRGPQALNYDPQNRQRRQDAPVDVTENGSIYIFKPWVLELLDCRLGGKVAVHEMLPRHSFQVDEPADFDLIERLIEPSDLVDPPAAPQLGALELLLLDFDGVLTDNRVHVDQHGTESVVCHRGDGWGIARLREAGVAVEVVSTETNPVVAARCHKLGIPCHQGIGDKAAVVTRMIAERGLDRGAVGFVGNDVNDLGAMRAVGIPIAVNDATREAREAAVMVTSRIGGDGAVREIADAILAAPRVKREVRRVA